MTVLIDKYIPFLGDVLAPYADVIRLAPEEFTPELVRDADALFVRTRTRCDEYLLGGSRVRFIATATIGFDHIDTVYCRAHDIYYVSCPGCNAQAVCDYIEEALRTLDYLHSGVTLGIVGVGHVGQLVSKMAVSHGMDILLNDPPLGIGIGLDELACRSDVITFHTPLTMSGAYCTYHLCDDVLLRRMRAGALVINAARGGIVDETALLYSSHPYVIDCWENEPNINTSLLSSPSCQLASYHIAGYSMQGKLKASQMCLDAFCTYFCLPILKIQNNVVPLSAELGDTASGWLTRITSALRYAPQDFELLRKQYKLR